MLDSKLQKYYEDRFSLFATQGWKDLMEDTEAMFKAMNNVLPIQNESDLQLKRGQLDILNWILTLKSVTEQAYEQLLSGDSNGD